MEKFRLAWLPARLLWRNTQPPREHLHSCPRMVRPNLQWQAMADLGRRGQLAIAEKEPALSPQLSQTTAAARFRLKEQEESRPQAEAAARFRLKEPAARFRLQAPQEARFRLKEPQESRPQAEAAARFRLKEPAACGLYAGAELGRSRVDHASVHLEWRSVTTSST